MLALHLSIDARRSSRRGCGSGTTGSPAYDMGDIAAQWFSDFLGQQLRLVRFDPEHGACPARNGPAASRR